MQAIVVADMDRPPPPQKMAETIADGLRRQIIRRELADGDFLPFEAELCAHFGTSRPTMREALRILETEGLLRIRRGGRDGPQVCAPDITVVARSLGLLLQYQDADLGAVYDAFLALVPQSARRLAEHHSDTDLERLQEQRARLEESVDDASRFLDEATNFLLLVVELAGNPVEAVISRLLAEVARAHRAAMSDYFVAKPRTQSKRAVEVLAATETVVNMVTASDTGVDRYLRNALGSHVRKAMQVPSRDFVRLV